MAPPPDMSSRLDKLQSDLVDQGRRCLAMLDACFESVFTRDVGRSESAIRLDDAIDEADVELEKSAVSLLGDATRAGAEMSPGQLRAVLTIVKINNELERIADVGVEVAQLVPRLAATPGAFPETFRVIANSCIGILRDTNHAVARGDAALAKVVLQSQHAVTAFKAAILRDAEECIARGAMHTDFAFLLHEIATDCEAVADHCTNIAEQVIYSTTGAIVRHTPAQWVVIPKPAV